MLRILHQIFRTGVVTEPLPEQVEAAGPLRGQACFIALILVLRNRRHKLNPVAVHQLDNLQKMIIVYQFLFVPCSEIIFFSFLSNVSTCTPSITL